MDLVNENDVDKIFKEKNIVSVIHVAAYKAIAESCIMPIEYHYNNITSTLVVLKIMKKYNVKNFVFSSSATVYGEAKSISIKESATNPYGRTKLIIEDILRDVYRSDNNCRILLC